MLSDKAILLNECVKGARIGWGGGVEGKSEGVTGLTYRILFILIQEISAVLAVLQAKHKQTIKTLFKAAKR